MWPVDKGSSLILASDHTSGICRGSYHLTLVIISENATKHVLYGIKMGNLEVKNIGRKKMVLQPPRCKVLASPKIHLRLSLYYIGYLLSFEDKTYCRLLIFKVTQYGHKISYAYDKTCKLNIGFIMEWMKSAYFYKQYIQNMNM
jgi:hypothetical protein